MSPAEFAKRYRTLHYVRARYRSLDTVAPLKGDAEPEVPNPIFTLSLIWAASYPNLDAITN